MKARDARGWIVGVLLAALAVGVMWWPQAARADWRSLTGPLPTFVNRVDYQISPDSQTVVFTADADTDDVTELYAVPVTGTLPIKLNPPLVEGGQVSDFIFTPDGKSVVYRADQEVDNRLELYIVPVAGGTAQKLSGSLVAGGNVRGYQIDSKNGRLVYIADAQINEQFELWSVPLTGGEPTNLSHLATAGRQVGDTFKFDPLSDRVVFNSNDNSSHDAHLYDVYSVPVTGGTPVQLNPPIVNAGGGDSGIYGEFDVVPGQSIVVFVAREKDTGMPGMPQSPRGTLYQVPTDGSAAAQALSFHMNADQRINNFRVSPAGTDVIYEVAKDDLSPPKAQFSTQGSLYRNAVGGGGAANVTETADPLFGTDNFQLLTDGSRAVYSFQNSESTSLRLEAATMLGVRTPLYDPGATGPKLSFFRLSPDSKRVMYQTQDEQGNTDGLFLVSPTGGNAESYGRATFQAFMPDSSRILYTRVVSDTFFTDLFSQQVGTGGELNLSKLDPLGSVFDTQVSADGKWIVFETQVDGHPELRVSDGEKAQPPTPTPTVTLTPTATPTGTLTPQATATPTATPTLRPGETPDPFEEHLPALKNEK